jgi:hypothetical protein
MVVVVIVVVVIVIIMIVVVIIVVLIVVVIVVSQYLQRFTCISVATGSSFIFVSVGYQTPFGSLPGPTRALLDPFGARQGKTLFFSFLGWPIQAPGAMASPPFGPHGPPMAP